ncbi:hypothetical protein CCS05_04960 [Levilactobacillus brevis]|nr:hypothetical protein [Levilactobacillus brevis]AWP46308.1 hypothetical protein CCS05_04960 [Levilactobacillus brevis]
MTFEFSREEALFIYLHLKKRANKEIMLGTAVKDMKNVAFEKKMNYRIFEEILSKYPEFESLPI